MFFNSEDEKLTLPAGVIAFVSIYSLHRDSTVFPDPEKFDPDRFVRANYTNIRN